MARTNYQRGRDAEYRCKRLLEELGVNLVFRSAGSRGPADLIAINPVKREIMLIQVKAAKATRSVKQQYSVLKELEGEYRVKAYIYHKKDGRRYGLEPL